MIGRLRSAKHYLSHESIWFKILSWLSVILHNFQSWIIPFHLEVSIKSDRMLVDTLRNRVSYSAGPFKQKERFLALNLKITICFLPKKEFLCCLQDLEGIENLLPFAIWSRKTSWERRLRHAIFCDRRGKQTREIKSLPGIFRLSLDHVLKEAEKLHRQGVPSIAIFCDWFHHKDEQGTAALHEDGLIIRVCTLKRGDSSLVYHRHCFRSFTRMAYGIVDHRDTWWSDSWDPM